MRLALLLLRIAWRAWPRGRRAAVEDEAVEAALRGFEKRRRAAGRSSGSPWAYLARVLLDVVRSGWAQRVKAAAPSRLLEDLLRDATFALRRLRRAPGHALAVIVILALGVGANAAVYSALRVLVLSPPPLAEPHELGMLRVRTVAGPDTTLVAWPYPVFHEVREAAGDRLAGLAGFTIRRGKLLEPGDPETVGYELVTDGYFAVLRLAPVAGRFFTPEEEGRDGVPGVAVLSHGLWQQRFGADPGAVGRTVTLEGSRLRIVGVAPRGFGGLTGDARLWVPVGQSRPNLGTWAMERRDVGWLDVVARVGSPGPTPFLAPAAAALRTARPPSGDPGEVDVAFTPLADVWFPPSTRQSVLLAAAGALLLLGLTVTNVFALQAARERRTAGRTALQLALGAARGRVLRERAAESLLLTLGGGLVGLALAHMGVQALMSLWPAQVFRSPVGYLRLVDGGAVTVDGGVVLVGLVVAGAAGLAATLGPAVLHLRSGRVATLRGSAPGAGGGRTGGGAWLLAVQVAVSVVLLVGSGLLAGTLRSLHAEQRGFDPEGLLVLRYSLVGRPAMASPAATRGFHDELRTALEGLPGVRSVSVSSSAPLGGGFITSWLEEAEGGPTYAQGTGPEMGVHIVDHAFFGTVGVDLERGRAFTETETSEAGRVVVISRRAAEAFFPGEDPVGRRLDFRMNSADPGGGWTVVGVAEDLLFRSPTEGMRPEVYVPLGFWAPVGLTALVRTAGPPEQLVPAARRALARIDPGLPFALVTTGAELRADDVAGERALGVVLGVFTALAVTLSAAGLWATVARSVAERRREIGVRMAVGARAGAVRALLVRGPLVPVLAGAAAGLLVAFAAAPRFEGIVFGLAPRDPTVLAGSAALLLGVCLLASWLPARAATRIDPVEALRSE